MKMLITGHRGLIGSACVRRFSKEYEVVTSNINLIDQRSVIELFKRHRPDIVINCAAKVGGIKSNRDYPVDFLLDNLKMQNNVFEACYEFDVSKLVMIGTSCLYPENASIPVSESSLLTGPFSKDVSAYATAKLAGLELCRAYSKQYGRNFMYCCPSNVYGPGDNYGPSAHVIPALIAKLRIASLEKKPLVVWGNGRAVREFIYSDDVADAIAVILNKWNSPEPINIGTGIGTSISQLVESLVAVSNSTVDIKYDASQPIGIPEKTFCIDRLNGLGWTSKTPLAEGLLKTWISFIEDPKPRFK